ncbi:solute carrier family 35 (UDP-galactose transporter), member B1 [Chaetoceros tenuissimus]|uniref:Solute carrier family 35 (UDP-galactose transporter), member B1 n=1 Tax=Chaetoceros tenuissimus TaxID=426638 RepID=A0AAD3HDU0_9STRA|nr:solute carrier family 35 (UDP-galactose transporter), member B1 [Chaetoceros tenuissimus]
MAPTVLTAGGAASLSLQKNKKSPPASISSDTNDEASPDRAAGSAPSSPVKQVGSQENEKLNAAYSGDLSSSDDEVSYDDSEDIEGQSEFHGLLSHEDGQRQIDDLYNTQNNEHVLNTSTTYDHDESLNSKGKLLWLAICFFGIMMSFVGYGLLLEYATSGGRKLHELSFLFVTSLLYTVTAAAGRHVRDEVPTTIPPARFAVLGITSMGSTFCSVRSLRYVIFPIQVLAKSCKPVPVMIMGALMGKKYPLKKYINVCLIVAGVGLFMGGGSSSKKSSGDSELSSSSQIVGIILLFISLCFDGGTGAYEDKLMAVHSVGPFDLMYNIQLGKTIIAGVSLLVLNQVHVFLQMCQDMGFVLVALGLTGAMGQVFIFVTISKFGALTCSIIGLARKVTTLVASIYFYGHHLNGVQITGLVICVTSMVMNFMGKKGKGGGHGHGHGAPKTEAPAVQYRDTTTPNDIELPAVNAVKPLTAGGR